MRTLYLASLLAFGMLAQVTGATKALAQTPSFTLTTDTVYLYGAPTATLLEGKFNISKNTSGTLNLVWEKSFDNPPPSQWINQFCDVNLCHAQTTQTAQFALTNTFPDGLMKWDINPNGAVGSTIGRIMIYPAGEFASVQTVVFIMSTDPLGTKDASANKLTLSTYPNPVVNTLTVEMPRPSNGARLEVYNIIGSRVASWPAPSNGGTSTYDVSTLAQGGYILRLVTPAGPVMSRTFSKVN